MERVMIDGHDVTGMNYWQIQEVFSNDDRSHCMDVFPFNCDCSVCPTKGLCEWLCDNGPYIS